MSNLALSLNDQGRYAEAQELHRNTMEIEGRVLGDDHPETLLSMSYLANSLLGQGRYAEAEELQRRTLEVQRRVLGKEHPDTLALTTWQTVFWIKGTIPKRRNFTATP